MNTMLRSPANAVVTGNVASKTMETREMIREFFIHEYAANVVPTDEMA